MTTEAKKAHYRDGYGRSFAPHPPDYTKCCQSVIDRTGWWSGQCSRKAAYGPDKAYCKQHDPVAVKARDEEKRKKWEAERKAMRPRYHANEMIKALRDIAAGHNDPRSLAAEIVAKVDGD